MTPTTPCRRSVFCGGLCDEITRDIRLRRNKFINSHLACAESGLHSIKATGTPKIPSVSLNPHAGYSAIVFLVIIIIIIFNEHFDKRK